MKREHSDVSKDSNFKKKKKKQTNKLKKLLFQS